MLAKRNRSWVLALMASTMCLSGCLPEEISATPIKETEMSDQQASSAGTPVVFSGNGISYRWPVMAPDACYVAKPDADRSVEGSTVTERRILAREPGICAQVLTEVIFSGEINGLTSRPEILVLEIVNPAGAVLDRQAFRRAN